MRKAVLMAKKITLGLAGAGWPTWQHIKGYRKLQDVEVAALCDIHHKRLAQTAEEYEIPKRYASFEAMLE